MITKVYQKPTMKVVKLQHTGILMVSGEVMQASRGDYDPDEQTWE